MIRTGKLYMKIGINISSLKNGHAGRGTGSYTTMLIEGLQQYGSNVSVMTYSDNTAVPDCDVIHYPFFDPFFLTLSIHQHIPCVVTVHDLIPILYRSHFDIGIKGWLKWFIQKQRLKKAAHIITDSLASKKDIFSILHYPESEITSIYLAPDKRFTPQSQNTMNHVLKKYALPERFLLYVGDVNWNKNVPSLLKIVERIDVPFVFAGKSFLNNELKEVQEISQYISSHNMKERIYFPGYIDSEDLPSLYSAAAATMQISYAEGFGLPVLESMACGTPCVVSNTSSLAEIAGPSILVDPYNVDSILSGVKQSLSLDRDKASKEAVSWSKKFTLEKTINQTVAIYKHVISS